MCLGPVTQWKLFSVNHCWSRTHPHQASSAIQEGLQPFVCWHQHQTTKPLDLRVISEIWERWASNSNQTRAIKSRWLCAYTCEWVCEFICACLTMCVCPCMCVFMCVCSLVYVHVSVALKGQSQRNFSLLVNKQLTIKAKTYGSHRVMVSINTAQTHKHAHTPRLYEQANDVTYPESPKAEHRVWDIRGSCWFIQNSEGSWV